jgi:hypothetical protein
MNIPRFWERARREVAGRGGRSFDLVCWRWSNTSLDDAREKAQEALDTACARVASGEELRGDYWYGLDRPLREEIISAVMGNDREPAAVITRNLYGALVLNSANVMFVDVDFDEHSRTGQAESGGGLAGLLAGLFGKKPTPAPSGASSVEDQALGRLDNWVRANRGSGMRVYRTAAGLRLIATHDVFDPASASTISAMEALGCDPLYVRLCRAQKSFRARLTPKPWRCGLYSPHIKYPFTDASQERALRSWAGKYEQVCQSWATCELVRTVGSEGIHPEVRPIVDLHDDQCRVGSGLKLA